MEKKIDRGRLKTPPAREVTEIMVEPTLAREEVERSYQFYIDVNKAHVLMLARQGIIGVEPAKMILEVARDMAAMGNTPAFEITAELEEMYFNLENYLIGKVGIEIGGQQHTARSRNDLHATIDRMEARKAELDICNTINKFRGTLLALARRNLDSVMSGYTHLQPSEPITFAHYLSAVSSALSRDFTRLARSWDATNLCPLGGGSMGSTTWNIDRDYTARLLGFEGLVENSLDCVCSRDYLLECMSVMAILANNLARLATDMRIWSAPEYGYIEVDDSCAVCSSIMPQKKNPWTFETTTSFSARVKGHSDAAWMTYKGLPYAFTTESMDLISNFWPCLADTEGMLRLLDVTMAGVKFHKERARDWAARNFSTVTELANTLVRSEGISFRAAHEIVAHVVGLLVDGKKRATEIDAETLGRISAELFGTKLKVTDEEVMDALDPVRSVESKTVAGGTAQGEVERQLSLLEATLAADRSLVAEREAGLARAKGLLESELNKFLA